MRSKQIPEVFQPPVASGTIQLRRSGSLAPGLLLLHVTHLPKAGVVFYSIKVLDTELLFEHNDAAHAILLADFGNCIAIHINPSLDQPTAQTSLNPTLSAACLTALGHSGKRKPNCWHIWVQKEEIRVKN